jgi:hypothetical protein
MSYIKTYDKNNKNILRLNIERKIINLEPEYQRNGDIWNLEKRQLLIDSILNDYDIPKLYFHVLDITGKKNKSFQYAVIDGRQRLETIWKFIDNKFSLDDNFEYFKDPKINIGGFTYSQLATQFPDLKSLFDSFDLPIVCVETDDLDLIDDMFLRLNEAVPLNAAEKRNAIRGPIVLSINQICKHPLFKSKIKFSNSRYQHKEAACRLLFLTWTLSEEGKIYDTKKQLLDNFVKKFKLENLKSKPLENDVTAVLNEMQKVFNNDDFLLRSQAYLPIYYLVFRDAVKLKKKISRQKLVEFRAEIRRNKELAEKDLSRVNYDLIEFDRMSVQGTNDASSIKERVRILEEYLKIIPVPLKSQRKKKAS